MNRITSAIAKMKIQIEERINLGLTTESRVKATSRQLDMDITEFVLFQEKKSLAVGQGLLTADEAQTVYAILGNTPTHFNRQHVAVKAVLTSLFRELLESASK